MLKNQFLPNIVHLYSINKDLLRKDVGTMSKIIKMNYL